MALQPPLIQPIHQSTLQPLHQAIGPANPSTHMRLFCFPYAGGSAALFRSWQSRLSPHTQVIPWELPGHGVRMGEPLITDLSALVALAARELEPYLDLPFAIFGHSMGALLGYELAHTLCEQGHVANQVMVSAHKTPDQTVEEFRHLLPDKELIDELSVLNGTPPEVLREPELLKLVLPIVRADFGVCASYRYHPRTPLPCPLVAFCGTHDPMMTPEHADAWAAYTTSTFESCIVLGDHFFMSNNHFIESLNAQMNAQLDILTPAPAFC